MVISDIYLYKYTDRVYSNCFLFFLSVHLSLSFSLSHFIYIHIYSYFIAFFSHSSSLMMNNKDIIILFFFSSLSFRFHILDKKNQSVMSGYNKKTSGMISTNKKKEDISNKTYTVERLLKRRKRKVNIFVFNINTSSSYFI